MLDGNLVFKMLSEMTEEERSDVFFYDIYDFETVRNEYDRLMEWDDVSCENAAAIFGDGDECPECDKVLDDAEKRRILRDALVEFDCDDDFWVHRNDAVSHAFQYKIADRLEELAVEKEKNEAKEA